MSKEKSHVRIAHKIELRCPFLLMYKNYSINAFSFSEKSLLYTVEITAVKLTNKEAWMVSE